MRAGRPVLVLSPEKMARNKKRAADKARSLANIAARKRAAGDPVWHSASVLPSSFARSIMAAAASAAAAESDSEEILAEGWAAPAPLQCPPPSLLSLSSLPPPLPQHSRAFPSSHVAHVDVRIAGVDAVVSSLKGGLARPSAGILLLAGLLQGRQLSSAKNAVAHVARWRALPIFNSQSVVEMQRLKGDADMGRRQLALPPGGGRTTIDAAIEELCMLLHATFGRRYEASLPKFLVTMDGAPTQMPHGNSADDDGLGHPPRMVSVVMAVDDRAFLDAWPGEYCDAFGEGGVEEVSTARAQRLHIAAGGMALFRGDVIHRGVENRGKRYLRRVHVFLYLRDVTVKKKWGRYTCPVREIA